MDKLASLGINFWSILFYLVNTGLLLAALTYFLYKPLLRFADKRREQIIKSIEEAKNLQDEFEKKLHESERRRHAVEGELKEELAKLHKFTEEKRKELVAEMDKSRVEMMQKAQKEIDERKERLIKDAEEEIKAIMTRIILNIVENKVPENVIQESISSAWKQYK